MLSDNVATHSNPRNYLIIAYYSFNPSYNLDLNFIDKEENVVEDFVHAEEVDQNHDKQKPNVVTEKESMERDVVKSAKAEQKGG